MKIVVLAPQNDGTLGFRHTRERGYPGYFGRETNLDSRLRGNDSRGTAVLTEIPRVIFCGRAKPHESLRASIF